MHQARRSSPTSGSPVDSPRITVERPYNPRDEESADSSTQQRTEVGDRSQRGLEDEHWTETYAQGQSTAPHSDAVDKLNQIITNYYTKTALIVLHSRVNLPAVFLRGSDNKKVNKWFNVVTDETDVLRPDLLTWKNADAHERRPPPMLIDVYLDTNDLADKQRLVIVDDQGRRSDVMEALDAFLPSSPGASNGTGNKKVVLERWRVELGNPPTQAPADLGAILPTVYKKSIVLFRSLFTYANFLPTWKLAKRQSQIRLSHAVKIRYRIYEGPRDNVNGQLDNLTAPIYNDGGKTTETYVFGVTDSPAGQFSLQVTYRPYCEFRVDDHETVLSSCFMGANDQSLRPSLPSDDTDHEGGQEIGSLPVRIRGVQTPELGQAYGSMSTFHQVGPTTGASPISALRAARDKGNASPSSPTYAPPSPKTGQAARLARRSGEVIPGHRKPSFSFQPFKAPPLSASPSLVDQPYGSSPGGGVYGRTAPANTAIDDKNMPPPSTTGSVPRRLSNVSPDHAVASSASASPKPAPISKYSSSFSHRRGRFSSGGGSKAEDDNASSGKASASSLTVQPTSEVLPEAGGASSGSIHTETDEISDFIKDVERGKNLFTQNDADAIRASAKKTSAALTKYQRMRDSNAALSDSMSASMVMQRSSSSSSKQLPSPATASLPTSSSPGKPISPHTPHTPAIPSRLSSNSVIEYPRDDRTDTRRHRLSHESRELVFEESTNDSGTTETETETETVTSNVNAIDIPTSPRTFAPSYRRSSSAVQRRSDRRSGNAVDDETGDLYGTRSMSLGAKGRQQLDVDQGVLNPNTAAPDQPQPGDNDATFSEAHGSRGGRGSTASSYRSNPTRSQTHRGRGSIGAPPSHGSASSSFGRGTPLLGHIGDRERDREPYPASGNSSAISVVAETRRGGGGMGRRFSSARPTAAPLEDEEPLLFTMSDFGVTRRSLEENRGISTDPPTCTRRGSGRRGGGGSGSGYHPWP